MRRINGSSIVSRRSLLKLAAAGAVGAAAIFRSRETYAADSPHLDVKDPAAVALGYVENASLANAKKYPTYVKGSRCDNCLLLQGSSGDYRPCNLFPGKLVSVSGWCSGWTAEI